MPFLLFLAVFFTSCIHNKKEEQHSAKFYFEKASYYKEKNNYERALEQLKKLETSFFYSPYKQRALLLRADIYFLQNKYSLAEKLYEKHLHIYPNKKRDYVLYRFGLSCKNQLPKHEDQDLRKADPAIKAFEALLALKQNSPYKEKASIERQKLLDKKAIKNLKIAVFYKSQGWHKAAFLKIKEFLNNYPKHPMKNKALLYAVELAENLNKDSSFFKKQLIQNAPNSKEAKSLKMENKKWF